MAPGTRAANYRCFLPDLAGFVSFASPRAAYRLAHNEQRRERDSNPRYLSIHTISNRAPSATRTSLQVFDQSQPPTPAPTPAPATAFRSPRPKAGAHHGSGQRNPGAVAGVGAGADSLWFEKAPAEREGFEPPVPLRVHLISNQAQSTRLCHLSINDVAVLRRTSSAARRIPLPAPTARPSRDGSAADLPTSDRASSPRPPSDCRNRRRRARRAR